jgi:AraC family transcriptional regulator, ethanolamine operon transcriptional activator
MTNYFADPSPMGVPRVTGGRVEQQGVYRQVANDANAQASNLRGWSQLYDQLSPGDFAGGLEGICFDSMHLFRESTNLTLRQSCTVHSDGWWFGIPVPGVDSFRVNSRTVAGDCIAVRPGNTAFELVTPQNFQIFGIVLSRDVLQEHLRSVEAVEVDQSNLCAEALQLGAEGLERLQRMLQEMLSIRVPEVLNSSASRTVMQNAVLDAIATVSRTGSRCERIARSHRERSEIVRRVRRYLLDHPNRVIAVPELCRVFHVSRRTLQYAFEQTLGINPNAYLRTLRLNGVRRDLRGLHPTMVSVQKVASDWGFWHLSQFAKEYRKHFNELPSETLKRRVA